MAGSPAANVGGIWSGAVTCSFSKSGTKLKRAFDGLTLRITQTSLNVAAVLDFGGESPLYQGVAAPSAAQPDRHGDVALVYCGTNDVAGDDPTFDELGRFAFTVKPGEVKGTLKGSSLVSFNGGTLGNLYAGTCKWAFERTALDAPNVPVCGNADCDRSGPPTLDDPRRAALRRPRKENPVQDPRRPLTWLASCLILGIAAGPAAAAFITYDLSGNWTGTITCSEVVAGVKQKTVLATTMKITQAGVNFGVQMGTGLDTRLYAGLANPNAKKPTAKGEAYLSLCGTDNDLGVGRDELVRISVSKADKVGATIKGFSHFSGPASPTAHLGTCKWKWKRVDQVPGTLATNCAGFETIVTGGAK